MCFFFSFLFSKGVVIFIVSWMDDYGFESNSNLS